MGLFSFPERTQFNPSQVKGLAGLLDQPSFQDAANDIRQSLRVEKTGELALAFESSYYLTAFHRLMPLSKRYSKARHWIGSSYAGVVGANSSGKAVAPVNRPSVTIEINIIPDLLAIGAFRNGEVYHVGDTTYVYGFATYWVALKYATRNIYNFIFTR